jgi:hypothetical protein
MKRAKILINALHSRALLLGEPVAIKVPEGAKIIELRLTPSQIHPIDSMAKVIDVFFNGRKA